MLASYHGHAALASLLVKHGADPNRINDRGQSILAGVVFKNEPEVIDILLEAGADPEIGQPSALEATRVRMIRSWLVTEIEVLTTSIGLPSRSIRREVQRANREVKGRKCKGHKWQLTTSCPAFYLPVTHILKIVFVCQNIHGSAAWPNSH